MAMPEPSPAASDSWMPSPAVEAVVREARLSVAQALYASVGPRQADLAPVGMPARFAEPLVAASPRWMRAPGAEPAVLDVCPQVASAPALAPANAAPLFALPQLTLVEGTRSGVAGRPAPFMPEAGFIPPDFHCQRIRGSAVHRLEWRAPEIAPAPPGFALRPALERLEDLVPRKAPPKTNPPGNAAMRRAVEAIAAGLFVAAGLWYGATTVRTVRPTAAVGQEVSVADSSAPAPAHAAPAPAHAAPQTGVAKGPLARVRNAIARRATVELTDTFHAGMESWGAAPQTWAPGWSRHPDGYVHPGPLALYHPSQIYSDYRLDFFAQIESQSMGWAVRAHDQQNYYAMKFTVVEPGLRPIIAMVHYPVVGGKKGPKVEVPLSVMVHNDTPYHVTVEVKGNRVITSIEGQEVDRWIDDTLASGGVGFFSEAGERARLYWMKLAANDDFLGRVCAYLSGSSGEGSEATAELRPLESPADIPQPGPRGAPPGHPTDVTLAAAETGPHDLRNRRIQSWSFRLKQCRTKCDRCLPA
jgi:hypothetical protein